MATRLRRGPQDHRALGICFSLSGGLGISAGQTFAPKIMLSPFAGFIRPAQSDLDLPLPLRGRPIQINEWYVQESLGLADVFSHSCEPNAGLLLIGEVHWIVSRRVILEGEEISWDYAMSQLKDEFFFYPPGPCNCGSARCRGERLGAESLPLDVAREYLDEGWGTAFIREKLLRRVREGL